MGKKSTASKRKKVDYGPCNSCEAFNYDINYPKCAKGINNSGYNAQTKDCPQFQLRWDWVKREITAQLIVNPPIQKKSKSPELAPIKIEFSGSCDSKWAKSDQLWNSQYQLEIEKTITHILSHPIPVQLKGKRIASIDIETTVWIPAARQGHINHISQSILDLSEIPRLTVIQIINMNRKPENVKNMLQSIWESMGTVDIQLVFNAGFDIWILKSQIEKFGLPFKFAENVVDLMRHHRSLALLEEWLKFELGFSRSITEKGNYEEYYNRFKTAKQLDPISSYNIVDTLTPILAYLLMSQNKLI